MNILHWAALTLKEIFLDVSLTQEPAIFYGLALYIYQKVVRFNISMDNVGFLQFFENMQQFNDEKHRNRLHTGLFHLIDDIANI